jgi:cytochrome c biogenesis protein CcmG/thiol:disulfide interchange protein DsbE
MNRKVIILGSLAFISLLVFVWARGFGTDPHAVPFMLAGKPAPDFHIKRLDTGEEVSLSQFRGQPVVLNFWATWCGPCKMEHPTLEWAAKAYQGKVVMLGIVFEDTEENTRKFLKTHGWSFTQLFDAKSTVAVDYGVAGVPETYFIGRDGIIKGKYAAPIDQGTMMQRLQEIL